METINPHNYDVLIGVDADVFCEIAKDARPFLDDPNAVLRRRLGLDDLKSEPQERNGQSRHDQAAIRRPSKRSPKGSRRTKSSPAPRAPKGSLTPEPEFEMPILLAIDQGGGELAVREVLNSVGEQMKETLNEHDLFEDEQGVARWEKRVPFVRLRLVERGLLDNDAPRGMWRITDAGLNHLNTHREKMIT